MFTVNKNPSVDDLRKFGWAMLAGFNGLALALLALAWWKAGGAKPFFAPGTSALVLAGGLSIVGTATGIVSLASANIARPVYIAWMTATVPIGIAMSTVLLTVLFVVILPVFSVIVRWGDPLRKRRKHGATYWEPYKRHEPTLERTQRPF